ncbi:RdgB/HAM1 family non-canonical purine NTP pyrophosphatase [Thermogladius sp. 4427co]|uniref:RdgB/HAM1 family non-canonical purine NTP pyrophosphatase n=1 Tax=Thermogladius sp. 4427co TaxID=3450718 RepID=UPI003F7A3634
MLTQPEDIIYFVTDNRHKFEEVKPIAVEYGFKLSMLPGVKLEIQSDNIEEVSRKSAIIAYLLTGRNVLVEDAGLFIRALNGFPGPYSNYVFRTIGIRGVLKLLEDAWDRSACFKSVATVVYDRFIVVESGEVCGTITREPRGDKGFGFDPIFIPEGSDKTFGEMSIDEKNRFSHRAISVRRAFEKLRKLTSQI